MIVSRAVCQIWSCNRSRCEPALTGCWSGHTRPHTHAQHAYGHMLCAHIEPKSCHSLARVLPSQLLLSKSYAFASAYRPWVMIGLWQISRISVLIQKNCKYTAKKILKEKKDLCLENSQPLLSTVGGNQEQPGPHTLPLKSFTQWFIIAEYIKLWFGSREMCTAPACCILISGLNADNWHYSL